MSPIRPRNVLFFPSIFHFFAHKRRIFPRSPLFIPHDISSLGYVMKRTAAFRVCPHNVLGN